MVSFGELRRLSLEWQTDIVRVERVYALDWLLKGIFDHQELKWRLVLQDGAALCKAYFPDYPQVEDADLVWEKRVDGTQFGSELSEAADETGRNSGLRFKLHSMRGTEARFEFTGPLGRRSAAQPHLPLRFLETTLRSGAVERPLLHPFSDRCEAMVRAVSLEEMAADRVALIGEKPRARDMFDLWFILKHGEKRLNRAKTRDLAEQSAGAKRRVLRAEFDADYRPMLERAWDNALRTVRDKPTFLEAETEIRHEIGEILS